MSYLLEYSLNNFQPEERKNLKYICFCTHCRSCPSEGTGRGAAVLPKTYAKSLSMESAKSVD